MSDGKFLVGKCEHGAVCGAASTFASDDFLNDMTAYLHLEISTSGKIDGCQECLNRIHRNEEMVREFRASKR
jgi:hypothetical protein